MYPLSSHQTKSCHPSWVCEFSEEALQRPSSCIAVRSVQRCRIRFRKHADFQGWGIASLRVARRACLKVKYLGRYGYIMGNEIIRHINEVGKDIR